MTESKTGWALNRELIRFPSVMISLRRFLFFIAMAGIISDSAAKEPVASVPTQLASRFTAGDVVVSDDFNGGLDLWKWELEKGGTVNARGGSLEIDVAGGCTVWLKTMIGGPILISYEATAVGAGGPNDRVSDLNCFWMARDARSPDDIFGRARNGQFSDYDQLRCYYVGLGGNSNTTTRFRRYIGEKGNRPLRPEHDLSAREFLLVPNATQVIQLVAAGGFIGCYRDGRELFTYEDPQPYTSGWFAFRTVTSHLKVKNFRVQRLIPRTGVAPVVPPVASH
jgi:hypothetical protein